MKKIFFLALALFTTGLLKAQNAATAQTPPPDITKVVQFKELDHDFGKIPFGKPAEFDLEMKNISKDTLRIENVQVGCGCTTPKWTPGPYGAGEAFKVGIGFNGATDGEFHKVVTIFFSGGLTQVIKFHGETFKTPDNPAPGNSAIEKLKPGSN